MSEGPRRGERFRIFRGSDGRDCDLMTSEQLEDETEAMARMAAQGPLDFGHDLKVLFDMPGLSLIRVWFKSGYPLPRHTHNVDCVYYITGGSIRIGHEELRAGDGFFVGADVPYTYVPGEEGVELLEIRPSNSFDIKVMGNWPVTQAKVLKTVQARQAAWAQEANPPKPGDAAA